MIRCLAFLGKQGDVLGMFPMENVISRHAFTLQDVILHRF